MLEAQYDSKQYTPLHIFTLNYIEMNKQFYLEQESTREK